jgi:hypothetical protein
MSKYVLTDPKCIQFYDEHPNLSFNNMNILIIEVYKQTQSETDNSKLDTKAIKKLLKTQEQSMEEHQKKISEEVTSFREIHSASSNNLNESIKNVEKFQQISHETINNIQRTISSTNSEISNILSGQLNEYKKDYLSEVKNILNSSALENSEKTREKLETYLNTFSDKLTASSPSENILNNVNRLLDEKNSLLLNNIQQPIFSHLSTSEDRITKSLSDIKEKTMLFEEIKEQFDKQNNSSYKGQQGESKLEIILNSLFNSAKVQNTTGIPHAGDFLVDRGEDKTNIVFENKDYNVNVPPKEIEKFISDCETQDSCGIFLSQKSGITHKSHYQIDIHKGNVLIYVHNTNYEADKIHLAVQIIDSLYTQLKDNMDDQDACISKETLERINKEFQLFIAQKKELINILKDSHKKLTSQIDAFQFPCIQSLLSDHFAQVEATNLSCNICNNYVGKNNRALSAHQRGCKKKMDDSSNNQQKNTIIEVQT